LVFGFKRQRARHPEGVNTYQPMSRIEELLPHRWAPGTN